MLNPGNISQLFSKLDDLKLVFTYGERLIPVIHNLAEFMKDTVPLLTNINDSIAESNQKIPKATKQIYSVTSATEMATTEILDLVDSLNGKLNIYETMMVNLLSKETEKDEFLLSLIPHLNMQDAEDYIKNFLEKNSNSEKLGEILLQIGTMKNDTESITVSLQVQDITSQQLATVNHLIESIQVRLSSLIQDLDETEIDPVHKKEADVQEIVSFDPNARYSKSTFNQQSADKIFNPDSQLESQDEIDKLFLK